MDAAALRGLFKGVCKIYSFFAKPAFAQPWSMRQQHSSTSSGFIVAGRLILTNAHSIAYATSVRVRVHGHAEKVAARVVAVAHDCDVAVLTVDDESFWAGPDRALTLADSVPNLHEPAVVVGFPVGGDQISITAGVCSRVDFGLYSHGVRENVLVQIDAAINSGNSGGPSFDAAGRVQGIAFQSLDAAELVGYIIPTTVVRHVLKDLERYKTRITQAAASGGSVSFKPFGRLGFYYQTMENAFLKQSLRVPAGRTGVLITRLVAVSDAAKRLQQYDMVCAVDGHDIADDGTVSFRGDERISFGYHLSCKSLGDTVALTVLRAGKELSVTCVLEDVPDLVPRTLYDQRPSYCVFAGLVFTPLSEPFLSAQYTKEWDSRAPVRLVNLAYHGAVETPGQQVVVLTQILANSAVVGYDPDELTGLPLVSINGVRINDLADVAEILQLRGDGGAAGGAGAGAGADAGGASPRLAGSEGKGAGALRRSHSDTAAAGGSGSASASSAGAAAPAPAAFAAVIGAGAPPRPARTPEHAAAMAAAAAAAVLRFEFAEGKVVFLPRREGHAATAEVLQHHAIPAALSADLLPPGSAATAAGGAMEAALEAHAGAGAGDHAADAAAPGIADDADAEAGRSRAPARGGAAATEAAAATAGKARVGGKRKQPTG
jgi:S1-C subfamily serine protease